jgi:hypothetical protein
MCLMYARTRCMGRGALGWGRDGWAGHVCPRRFRLVLTTQRHLLVLSIICNMLVTCAAQLQAHTRYHANCETGGR